MAVIQFPFRYSPIGDMKEFTKVLAVHTGAFPQFFYFGFAVHRIFSINKKYTLRNYYSIRPIITQRVNCKLLSSVVKRAACSPELAVPAKKQEQPSCSRIYPRLMSIFQHQLRHNINTAVKCRIIFRIIIILLNRPLLSPVAATAHTRPTLPPVSVPKRNSVMHSPAAAWHRPSASECCPGSARCKRFLQHGISPVSAFCSLRMLFP